MIKIETIGDIKKAEDTEEKVLKLVEEMRNSDFAKASEVFEKFSISVIEIFNEYGVHKAKYKNIDKIKVSEIMQDALAFSVELKNAGTTFRSEVFKQNESTDKSSK